MPARSEIRIVTSSCGILTSKGGIGRRKMKNCVFAESTFFFISTVPSSADLASSSFPSLSAFISLLFAGVVLDLRLGEEIRWEGLLDEWPAFDADIPIPERTLSPLHVP